MMADSEGANEPGATAAETNGGDQQVKQRGPESQLLDPEAADP